MLLLRVHLNRSRYLAAALVSAHLASACILIPLDLPGAAKFATAVVIALALGRTIWCAALLRNRDAVIAIELWDRNRIAVQTRAGEWQDVQLLGTTYATPLLTVLNLRCKKRLFARHVVIAPDSANSEDLRRMRVWLRWAYRSEARGMAPHERPLL